MRISEIVGVCKNASIVSLITEMKEETTKTGDTYVSANLADKSESLPVKFWGCSFATLKKSAGQEVEPGMIVEVSGDIKEYNGKLSLNLNQKDGEVAIRIRNDLDVNDFVYSQPLPIDKLIRTIGKYSETMVNATLKELYISIFSSIQEPLHYYPFGVKYHKEKGGAAYHLYNVICRIKEAVKRVPTVMGQTFSYNEELLVTAALASLLSSFKKFHVDPVSGKITEKEEKYCLLCRKNLTLIELCKYTKDDDSDLVLALKHCVMCLYDEELSPATPEARLLTSIISEELNTYLTTETIVRMGEETTILDNLLNLKY